MSIAEVGEVALAEDGVGPSDTAGSHQVLVGFCYRVVVERSTPTIEHVAEDVCLAIGAKQLCHVGKRLNHLLGLVDVTILCNTVLLQQQCVVDVYVAGLALTSHEYGEVLVGDVVLRQMLIGEVKHHGQRRVVHQIQTFTAIFATEAPPVVFLLIAYIVVHGQCVAIKVGDGVSCLYIGVATHEITS